MATRTRSHSGDSPSPFVNQNLISHPGKEVCSFNNADIAALRNSSAFPDKAIIRPFDRSIRSDVSSNELICFIAYPFSLGLQYPFPEFIMEFFQTTGLCFAQTMPMVRRILLTLNQIKTFHVPDLCIEDLPIAYRSRNEDGWQRKFFFVKRDSIDEGNSLPVKWLTSANFKELAPPTEKSQERIKRIYQLPDSDRSFSSHLPSSSQYSSSEMSAPVKIPETFELEDLDSYSGPAQVKKEPSKASTASKSVTSSKATAVPKPSPIVKTRASSSLKRKEPDSLVASDAFPYENHGFTESSKFMIGFLNQGLERLVHLYEDSCGLVKMLEIKLKKAETDVADQATIAAAKSKHYEDKYKAMTQEHQATIKKITQEAQAKYDAA
ncbi:hypothetical protein HanPSC8_Chr13g0548731 [Helianthus annuus]|nr:hypothetical protein HanPSC8_Chr13g0548731 [Helianthus annuus]